MNYLKMDDNPGMSLFQNSHFDAIKSNTPAPEEIEAEQDQKRYQQELEQILEDEFEDLADINSSVNSSYSLQMNGYHNSVDKKSRRLNGQLPSHINSSDNYHYKSKDYSSLEQLEVLYQVRLREIEKLRNENQSLQEQCRQEKCDLTATIKQLCTEKDKLIMSHNEVQKMLAERTSKLSEAERELSNFREKWSESEKIKSNALHELEMNKITIRELEKRLMAAEKNSYKNEERNFDNLLKELTSKNKREISDLQRKIHNLNNKIVTKEIDYAKLEQQLIDTQRSHESVLSEKTKLIDKLNASLAECHSRYQSLLMDKKNSDVSHLLHEIQQKTLEIDGFKSEIMHLKEQIARFENIAENGFSKPAVSDRMRKQSLSPVSHSEIVKFKKELQAATDNFKSKQAETETLREKIFTLSKEVETLRRTKIDSSTEIEMLKAERENLIADLAKNQKEQEMLKISFMDYITKTDILHQEQISELELVSSKKLLELEVKMKELEVHLKDDAMKAFTEEVNQITSIYSNHFSKLNAAVEQLKTDQDERNSQIRQLAAKVEKYREEAEKIYGKYRNARKIAITLKQITEDRTQLLRRHHKQFVQTLNEIQKYLDNALISKTIETDKLTELIVKSAKNTKNVDELLGNDEMNAMLLDINKKLMCSG